MNLKGVAGQTFCCETDIIIIETKRLLNPGKALKMTLPFGN